MRIGKKPAGSGSRKCHPANFLLDSDGEQEDSSTKTRSRAVSFGGSCLINYPKEGLELEEGQFEGEFSGPSDPDSPLSPSSQEVEKD